MRVTRGERIRTGYGLTAGQGGSGHLPATAVGLTAVDGCPGMYIAAGTLEHASGTRLIIGILRPRSVTVATSPSTVITRPVSATVSDITDGSQIEVTGTWSGGRFAASKVGIGATFPVPLTQKPKVAQHVGQFDLPGLLTGTVTDAHDGSFSMITYIHGPGTQVLVHVITSHSTDVMRKTTTSLSHLDVGANVVAVGQIGPDGVMTASTVTESWLVHFQLGGPPPKFPRSGCSASAIAARMGD